MNGMFVFQFGTQNFYEHLRIRGVLKFGKFEYVLQALFVRF